MAKKGDVLPKNLVGDPAINTCAISIALLIQKSAKDNRGWCEMTQNEIAQVIHKSRVTVQRALSMLIARGHAQAEPFHRSDAHYRSLRYRLIGAKR